LETRSQRIFYAVFLPLGVLANLVLGVLILTGLRPETWAGWLQIGAGAFCCAVAGWLAAAAWSKSYWTRTMTRQITIWRRIADAIFVWMEDAPLPADSLRGLKTSLDEAVSQPGNRR
jgi:TRAP-type C4-dicarboxylate transport system permease small subunit